MNRKIATQHAVCLSATVAAAPDRGAAIRDWHRRRLAALEAQIARIAVRGYPRRHPDLHPARVAADLALERERHRDFLASFNPLPPRTPSGLSPYGQKPRPSRATIADFAMTQDWRNQLDAVKDELLAVP